MVGNNLRHALAEMGLPSVQIFVLAHGKYSTLSYKLKLILGGNDSVS